MNSGSALYTWCCSMYNVNPDKHILSQVERADIINVRRIDASGTFVGSKGALAVLEFLRNHRCLEEIALPQNDLDVLCVDKLSKIIREGHPSLRAVDISNNRLSTASVRQLWDALRSEASIVVELNLDACGVEDEWVTRVQQTLQRRKEFLQTGFYPHGVPRPITAWRTIFLLVVGEMDLIHQYCEQILFPLGSYIAPMRLRVAPLTIDAEDTKEVVLAKMRRCQESHNYQLPWCVGFVSSQLGRSEVEALRLVCREKPVEPPPLRSKLGTLRDPVYRSGKNAFLYYCVSPEEKMKRKEEGSVKYAQWSSEVGLTQSVGSEEGTLPATLVTRFSFNVRCQSDLMSSFMVLFSEEKQEVDPSSPVDLDHALPFEAEEANLGDYHPKKTKIALDYVKNDSVEVGIPLLLYGGASIGKEKIILKVARDMQAAGRRVHLERITPSDTSIVVFLYHLLQLFSPSNNYRKSSSNCLQSLSVEVCSAIEHYAGPPLILLVSHLERLDTFGCHPSVAVEWLPPTFPKTLKIIISLNTECPSLPLLRLRAPQPYESQVAPISDTSRINLFKQALRKRNVSLPETFLSTEVTSRDQLTAFDTAFLEKEGSDSLLYIHLSSIFIQVMILKERIETEYDTLDFLTKKVPGGSVQVVEALCGEAEGYSSPLTVQYVLLSLSTTPLAVPDLQYICEELSQCPKYSTLPTLIYLSDVGLVEWKADATVYVAHPVIRGTVCRRYANLLDTVSVLVENHLYRLVTTKSLEIVNAFKYLTALMIENGNILAAFNLMRNTLILDFLLTTQSEALLLVIDSIFRLLVARSILLELPSTPGDPLQIDYTDAVDLVNVLVDVRRSGRALFQSSLLQFRDTPLMRFAQKHVEHPPYPVLAPVNNGCEDTIGKTFSSEKSFSFCHNRGDYVVASSDMCVVVFNSLTGVEKARLSMPFEKGISITGSLLAAGTRVVVVSAVQLIIWDFEINTRFLLDDITTFILPSEMNTFGSHLIVHHTQLSEFYVLDVTKKTISKKLPVKTDCKRALFCGDTILLVGTYQLHLLQEDRQTTLATLDHSGAIGAVECNGDGRLIATGVGNVLWMWSSAGGLLHSVPVGVSDILSLKFDSASTLLMVECLDGIQIRDTLSSLVIGNVKPVLSPAVPSRLTFSDDGCFLVGTEGKYVMLWNTKTCDAAGAYEAPLGTFTAMCEGEGNLYACCAAGVKRFDLKEPIPSVETVIQGVQSSNLHTNSKVSSSPIKDILFNPSGSLLSAVDQRGNLFLYSVKTGHRIEHPLPPLAMSSFVEWTPSSSLASRMTLFPSTMSAMKAEPLSYCRRSTQLTIVWRV
ncbi:hypothetical protein AGDE_07933 [Angomonas deanei]|uniref:Uncharacterized protein n=1 Tax=Angomonas deanei TaxID=59799 RepID=A0A7G2CHY8_9TRYP|nr:hypothetical protein AGDE_07933 [Angomonas deanei]CAD2218303.1 hypothetical protein, conserved [Angomonas deanei]|eukprot:EPY34403.1 hypothetical protein AGDE_07933 [Angomonas deanei]